MLSGCAGNPITVKSFPSSEINKAESRNIIAEACGFQLLLFIPISINSRLERAFTQLQQMAGNDKLAALSIEEYWRYAFVGTVYCTRLEATAYSSTASK